MDNMNPNIWGSSVWKTIHYISINYPLAPTDDDKNNIKIFLLNLQHILPCAKCREHYKLNLIKYPIDDNVLSSKLNLFKWTNDLHNEVNRMNGKAEMSLEDAFNLYSKQNNNNNKYIIAFVIIIIIVLIIIMKMKN